MQEQADTLQKVIDAVITYVVTYSFQVVGAIIILFIGLGIANSVSKLLLSFFQKKSLDITLARFITSIVRILVIVFAVIIALGKFGITIAPFVAALGALAFGASFAIQGPLSNYGAGLSIILSRPFVVGDTITVAGESGVVQEVKLACTVLTDEDGIVITIPNKHIVGENLRNSRSCRIVEGVIGVGYGDDPEKAIRVISETIKQFSEVGNGPQVQIGIQDFGESSVNIGFRYWAPTVKYYQTSFAVNLAVYKAIQQAGITIPFPRHDVHIFSEKAFTPPVSSK